MKKHSFFPIILFLVSCIHINIIQAQISISANGSVPDNSAILDLKSNTKGFLPPRMNNASKALIQSPADGLVVYNTDAKSLQVYISGKGWSSLETIPSGRIFVSDSFPDPLYPLTDYDYLGVFYQANAFKKNLGALAGDWTTKQLSLPDMANTRQFAYTGSSTRKVLVMGNVFHNNTFYCDSCMVTFDLNTNQFTEETVGHIRRYDEFTATTDTTNSRIFIWGGLDSLNFDNPTPDRTFHGGFIYNYLTGAKVLIDTSAAAPVSRVGHSAEWAPAANKLLIFCGVPQNSGPAATTNTCYRYDPSTSTWNALANFPLTARRNAITVYDGLDRVIVWGGTDLYKTMNFYDGAVYSISSNTWSIISTVNAPARLLSNGSWTGTDMIVSSPNINPNIYDYKAWRYNLTANTWTLLPDIPMYNGKIPVMNYGHLWNGTNLFQLSNLIPGTVPLASILWSYSFANNSWTALPGIYLNSDIQPVQASNAILYHSTQGYFYRFDPSGGASATYQVQDQNFHYYKKK